MYYRFIIVSFLAWSTCLACHNRLRFQMPSAPELEKRLHAVNMPILPKLITVLADNQLMSIEVSLIINYHLYKQHFTHASISASDNALRDMRHTILEALFKDHEPSLLHDLQHKNIYRAHR